MCLNHASLPVPLTPTREGYAWRKPNEGYEHPCLTALSITQPQVSSLNLFDGSFYSVFLCCYRVVVVNIVLRRHTEPRCGSDFRCECEWSRVKQVSRGKEASHHFTVHTYTAACTQASRRDAHGVVVSVPWVWWGVAAVVYNEWLGRAGRETCPPPPRLSISLW